MLKLHIANTFFEWELETCPKCSLPEAFCQHEIFRQLQFLPILYAGSGEIVLICDNPEEGYWDKLQKRGIQIFTLTSISSTDRFEIESWGPSQLIAAFAKKHKLIYSMPDWELVREVNSKRFSFECSPKLPYAALLNDETEAKEWLHSFTGKKVFKTCYGVSGKGHLIVDGASERIAPFLQKQLAKRLPVIGEPWVDRVLDFSTQWEIGKNAQISYVGATLCENDSRGQYRFNTVGDEEKLFTSHLPFLKEHIRIAEPILSKIAQLGFFGNLGIDAMLYTLPSRHEPLLHPIVEINARKTMGWAALQFQRRYHPSDTVRFSYAPHKDGYLPQSVDKITFTRNLAIDIYN